MLFRSKAMNPRFTIRTSKALLGNWLALMVCLQPYGIQTHNCGCVGENAGHRVSQKSCCDGRDSTYCGGRDSTCCGGRDSACCGSSNTTCCGDRDGTSCSCGDDCKCLAHEQSLPVPLTLPRSNSNDHFLVLVVNFFAITAAEDRFGLSVRFAAVDSRAFRSALQTCVFLERFRC